MPYKPDRSQHFRRWGVSLFEAIDGLSRNL